MLQGISTWPSQKPEQSICNGKTPEVFNLDNEDGQEEILLLVG